jgi:peptidoglycan/xylan/chitin deacetylase (PgdA/CDA1 family)
MGEDQLMNPVKSQYPILELTGKRRFISKLLDKVGGISIATLIRSRCAQQVTILAYHRVLDIDGRTHLQCDTDIISASIANFKWQMEYIKQHFTPISFATLITHIDNGKPLPPGAVIVTFDDGYSDNYTNAFPVLRKLGIPATIFITTDYIDKGELFWFDAIKSAILSTERNELVYNGNKLALTPFKEQRQDVSKQILSYLKNVKNPIRHDVLNSLLAQLLNDSPKCGEGLHRPLDWLEVQEMAGNGIEFGSHTVTHPNLLQLDNKALAYELEESKRQIENKLGKACQVIAYPIGGKTAFDERVCRAVSDAGYRLGVSYLSGENKIAKLKPYALRRMHVENNLDQLAFRTLLALPRLIINIET